MADEERGEQEERGVLMAVSSGLRGPFSSKASRGRVGVAVLGSRWRSAVPSGKTFGLAE